MKLNIITNEKVILEVSGLESIKEIAASVNVKPRLFQVGGALGGLYRDYDSLKILNDFDMYEDSLIFLTDFCPIDYARFMCRFVIRELNIINDTIRKVHDAVEGLTRHKTTDLEFKFLKLLLEEKTSSLGETLLYKNIKQLIEWYEPEFINHIDGYCKQGICRGLIQAQCINACPAHIHIPGFVALMKDEDYAAAYQLMRQENPLSSVCGSVCARPCEIRCRRGEITGTVGVRALQRFISSEALKEWKPEEKCLPDNKQSIAIVGGGPAGLTAAYYLRRTGYAVTIYERHFEAGGMLSFGVPKYRLPSEQIREEIKTIESLGVKIITNYEVDKNKFETLKLENDAVLIATGTPIGHTLNIDHQNVLAGIDFLKSVHLEKMTDVGKKVLVVGGGDVALDCARTAKRLNAEVIVMSLESYDEMRASEEEKIQSVEEDVTFKSGFSIDYVEGQTIYLKSCKSVLDEAFNFKPIYEKSDEKLMDIDTVIFAIGQRRDIDFIDIKTSYNIDDHVFVAGDVIKPTIVIDAIAQGKTVAHLIDQSLVKKGLYVGDKIEIPEKVLNIRTFDDDLKEVRTTDKEKRVLSFDQVNQNYSVDEAKYEASRCMRCDRNSTASLLLGR